MKDRGLTENDIIRAAKTYLPSGGRDEFLVFSSGGQSGQMLVYGVPSMKILKYIAVFTPEPWQGYGFDIFSELKNIQSFLYHRVEEFHLFSSCSTFTGGLYPPYGKRTKIYILD